MEEFLYFMEDWELNLFLWLAKNDRLYVAIKDLSIGYNCFQKEFIIRIRFSFFK